MNAEPIIVETEVNAPADYVWQAITDSSKMRDWYFDLTDFQAKEGFTFQFYGGTEEKQYLHYCKVMEVMPGKKLSHSWMYENVPVETIVTWELFGTGNTTLVRLTHFGVENLPADNKDFASENFVAGWTHLVKTALKDYIEKR